MNTWRQVIMMERINQGAEGLGGWWVLILHDLGLFSLCLVHALLHTCSQFTSNSSTPGNYKCCSFCLECPLYLSHIILQVYHLELHEEEAFPYLLPWTDFINEAKEWSPLYQWSHCIAIPLVFIYLHFNLQALGLCWFFCFCFGLCCSRKYGKIT